MNDQTPIFLDGSVILLVAVGGLTLFIVLRFLLRTILQMVALRYAVSLWGVIILITLVAGAGMIAVVSGAISREPARPTYAELDTTYSVDLACTGGCLTWAGTERLDIETPTALPTAALDLFQSSLASLGWHMSVTAPNETHLLFTRDDTVRLSSARKHLFLSTTGDIDLATEIVGSRPFSLTSGRVVYFLRLSDESRVVLEFPRLAVIATTPPSEPKDITDRRQQRIVSLADLAIINNGSIQTEILPPAARSQLGKIAATITLAGLFVVLSILVIRNRQRFSDAVRSMRDRRSADHARGPEGERPSYRLAPGGEAHEDFLARVRRTYPPTEDSEFRDPSRRTQRPPPTGER